MIPASLIATLLSGKATEPVSLIRGVYSTVPAALNSSSRTVLVEAKAGDTLFALTCSGNVSYVQPTAGTEGSLSIADVLVSSLGYNRYALCTKTLTSNISSVSVEGHCIIVVVRGTHPLYRTFEPDTNTLSAFAVPSWYAGKTCVFLSMCTGWGTPETVSSPNWKNLLRTSAPMPVNMSAYSIEKMPDSTIQLATKHTNTSVSICVAI